MRQGCSTVFVSLVRSFIVLSSLALPVSAVAQPVGHVPFTNPGIGQMEINPNTDRVYIAGGFAQNFMTVIDASNPSSPSIVTTISAGNGGSGVIVNPTANTFFTSNGFSGQVLRYDGVTNTQNGTVGIGACGGIFDYNPNTNLVYVVRQCAGGGPPAGVDPMYAIDAATMGIVGNNLGTGGVVGTVRVNRATGKAYARASANTSVFGPSPAFTFGPQIPNVYPVAVNHHNNRLYLQNVSTGAIHVHDGATDGFITTLPPAGAFSVNTANDHLYVTDPPGGNSIKVLDGVSHNLITTLTIPSGKAVQVITADSTKNRLYVVGCVPATCSSTSELYVLLDPDSGIRCEIDMSQPSYTSGQTITATSLRFANTNTTAASVEIKVWLGAPTGKLPIINVPAASFPAGLDVNLGPVPLFPVTAATPPGQWEFSCRILDPITGKLLAEDLNGFVVVP